MGSNKGGGKGWGGKGDGNPSQAMISRVAKKSPETVAWIGGLDKAIGKEGNKKLKAHVEALSGSSPKFVNIGPKGQGGAIFGSAEEAQTAISAMSGSNFMGKTLEFDAWTKK